MNKGIFLNKNTGIIFREFISIMSYCRDTKIVLLTVENWLTNNQKKRFENNNRIISKGIDIKG